jgi:hypothetical protein
LTRSSLPLAPHGRGKQPTTAGREPPPGGWASMGPAPGSALRSQPTGGEPAWGVVARGGPLHAPRSAPGGRPRPLWGPRPRGKPPRAGLVGAHGGASIQPSAPVCVRARARHSPQGPASEPKRRGGAGDGRVRTRGARARGRVPRAPREGPAAPCAGATEATASASVWSSLPTERGFAGDRADRRGRCRPVSARRRCWCRSADPRGHRGQPTDQKS